MRRIARAAAILALASGVAGCTASAPGGDDKGFMPSGTVGLVTISGVRAGRLTEIVVPFPSDSAAGPVHVLSVRLDDPAPSVRLRPTVAYQVDGLPGLPSPGQEILGTRSVGCPRNYRGPRPVTAIALAPHRAGHWIAVIALTVTRPGTYHLSRARISYSIHGTRGWQYQSLGLIVRYSGPPGPALRPVSPRDDGCSQPAG